MAGVTLEPAPTVSAHRRARLTTLLAGSAVGAVALHLIVQAVRSREFYWADDYSHLLFSRGVADFFRSGDIAKGMAHLLSGWGRPIMTLTYVPAAVVGNNGAVRATSLALLFAAAGLCAATARRYALPVPLLSALFLLTQPLTATLGFSALPGLVFTTLLAAGFWLRARGNLVLAAVVISLLPLARLEGVIVIGICALFALKGRQARVLAALSVGLVAWVVLSALFVQDALFAIHSGHTTTFTSSFKTVPSTYVIGASYLAFGPVVGGLALASPFVKRFADPLVPLTAAALLAFYDVVWAVGGFESLPNPIYLATAGAPVALCAHVAVAGLWKPRPHVPVHGLHIAAAALFMVALAVGGSQRVLVAALGIVAFHQFGDRLVRAESVRRFAVSGLVVLAIVFGVAMTHSRPARGAPKLVAQIRKQFATRLGDIVTSNDPTFNWEVDPKPIEVDRQHALGTLLIWNTPLAKYGGQASDEQLVRDGFEQIWTATDRSDTLVVWERHSAGGPPGSGSPLDPNAFTQESR